MYPLIHSFTEMSWACVLFFWGPVFCTHCLFSASFLEIEPSCLQVRRCPS